VSKISALHTPTVGTLLHPLLDALPDATVMVDREGRIAIANHLAEQMFGYAPGELIGQMVEVLLPARVRPKHARLQQAFQLNPQQRAMGSGLELLANRKDGSEFPVDIMLSPMREQYEGMVAASIRDISHSHNALRQSRESQKYARSLIEASLDPLVTISAEGKITDVNEATTKVTGVSRECLVGTDFSDYFTEPNKAREGYQQVFAQGFVTNYPLTIRHKEGHLTDVLYNASVYKAAQGNVLGVFAAARDVTESKRLMREYSETKNLLDNILQSSIKYSIIGKDLDYRILSWNEGARRNYGYSAHEILGKHSEILHTPEDVKSGAVAKLLATAYDTGLAEGEFERIRKDGTRFVANVVVTRRNDASGNPVGYLLMSSDISEKKQAEQQLQFASQYARSLIEASLDPLVTISPEGRITDVNEATVKVTGVSREELIGTEFSDYFTAPKQARHGYQQVLAKGSITDYPLTIRHRNRQLTEVLYNASVYKDVHGNVLGVFAAARDVTAQKKAEAEIADQRRRELERLSELERFQKLTVGRELKMIDLKKEIEELRRLNPTDKPP